MSQRSEDMTDDERSEASEDDETVNDETSHDLKQIITTNHHETNQASPLRSEVVSSLSHRHDLKSKVRLR